jgi:hypothetical protein
MRTKTILRTMVLTAMILLWVSVALPACVSSVPSELRVGESACVRVCRNPGAYPAIELLGPRVGPEALPILTLQAGCNAANTNCNYTCTAITPPSWPFELGGDPYFPDQYYARSTCLTMYLYWVHDNVWWLEIYTTCDGCFCLSYDSQLPVEISSPLAATAGDNEVTLRWATASESQNDRFEIYRDGHRVGTVQGLGTSSSGRAYSWTDETVQNGTTYTYTLEGVDINETHYELGQVTATPTAGEAGATDYRLYQNYPNPFNPVTRISFDLRTKTTVTLTVYNPMGAVVATLVDGEMDAGPHAVDFDGSRLTSGLYFCSLRTSDGFSATRKMLLVK